MALREKVLLKKAEKFELKESQKILVNREHLITLGRLLNDAYVVRRPKPNEYHHRKELIRVFNEIAREIYGNSVNCPVVEEFGSFSMDLFTTGSDLDLSVNFNNSPLVFPRDQKIKTLRKFTRKFYALQNGGHVCGVHPIFSAKVPIVKVVDAGSGIECDLSVENRDGILKSEIIHLISSIDERFPKLSFLMKAWAKAHDINSSKDRTLNSLSIILLVAFHLQTRDPPILPPFSAILKDGEDLATVKKSIRNFKNYGLRNTESLGELFVSFLVKLASVEKLWPKGLCASPYQGRWTSKTWDTKIASMSVEDFTDRTQNVSRAVGKLEVEGIYNCIQVTIQSLGSFMNGKIEVSKLKESLFGVDDVENNANPLPPGHIHPAMNKKRKERNQHVTMKNVPNPNVLVEARAMQNWAVRPATLGQWGGTQHQALIPNPVLPVNTTPVTPWAARPATPVDYQSTKRMRVREGLGGIPTGRPGTQGWGGPPIGNGGGPGWGAAPSGSWGRTHEADFINDPCQRPREMQPKEDWGRGLQPPPTGMSFPAYGPFR